MNILIINFEYPPIGGGAASITKLLAEHFAIYHNVTVLTQGFKSEEIIHGNLKVIKLNCGRKSKFNSNFLQLSKFILKCIFLKKDFYNHFNITHCHFALPTGIIAYFLKRKYGIPYIITIHGSDIPGYNPFKFKFIHLLLQFPLKLILEYADKIVSPSIYLKKLISQKFPKYKKDICVIYNGVSEMTYNNKKSDEKNILLIGRLTRMKGFEELLAKIDELKLNKKNKIFIAGDGELKDELKKIVHLQKNKKFVHFLGAIEYKSPAFYNLYNNSHLVILPSMNENCSMVLLEAIHNKSSVLAKNCGGNPEIIKNDHLFTNTKDCIKKINSFLSSNIYQNSFKKGILEKTTIHYCGNSYLKLFKKIW